jgi:chromosome segregation ATPase
MNDSNIPSIAEAKSIGVNSKSIFQREVEYFCGFADTINEQKSLLKTQQLYINDLETDLKLAEEKSLHLKDEIKRITSRYLDQEYEIKRVKAYNQELYSKNVDLRRHIVKLEEELKQLKSKFAV